MPNLSTYQQALHSAQMLGLDRLDAQLLLLHALARPESDRAWLLAHGDDALDETTAAVFYAFALRRAADEPLAYIVGSKEFFGLTLKVDVRVLVPRPDTETLVEWMLEILRGRTSLTPPCILDLGTGSGAIALAVAHTLQTAGQAARITAVDASVDALAVASGNARALKLSLQFILSNWFKKVGARFHIIASNPPYIASEDAHLAALKHEPLQALASGPDGLDDLRQIIGNAPDYLEPGGWLVLEHGYNQSGAVQDLLSLRGFRLVQSRNDLAGIARCSGGQWAA